MYVLGKLTSVYCLQLDNISARYKITLLKLMINPQQSMTDSREY